MAVLPENMDKLNVEDPQKSLSIIENYIRYMGERIEFSMRNMTKTVSAAGVSSAEMYVLITAMGNNLSAMQSVLNGQAGQLTSLTNNMTALAKELETLASGQQSLTANLEQLSSNVSALVGSVESLQAGQKTLTDSVNAQASAISSLEGRVSALENIDGGA